MELVAALYLNYWTLQLDVASVAHVEFLRLRGQLVQCLAALAQDGLPIGLILNDTALLDDVGKAWLIERQQAIFQHRGVILFERRQ